MRNESVFLVFQNPKVTDRSHIPGSRIIYFNLFFMIYDFKNTILNQTITKNVHACDILNKKNLPIGFKKLF